MTALNTIISKAKANPKHIVLPEGHDPRVVEAAIQATQDGIAEITLIGASPMQGINVMPSESDVLQQANKLVASGKAHGSIAGASVASAAVIRSALDIIGVDRRYKSVSSCFIMQLNCGRPVLFSDCALVIDPNPRKLASIAIAAANAARELLQLNPNVAMLSFATHDSAEHKHVDKVRHAMERVISKRPDLNIDGPLQFDAAFDAEVGASKAPASAVAGAANVFIFPDLNSGNIGYKIAERLGGAKAIGPILQGLASPANDLSRGCSADDVFNMIAVTVLQAQALESGTS